jgi:tetratricopeptide (TPR) repeat protein
VYVEQGGLDHAAADLTETIRLRPDFGDAYFERGTVCNMQGLLESPDIGFVSPGGEQLPANVPCGNQERWLAAINDFSRSINYHVKLAESYYQRGFAHLGRGEAADTIADMDAALRLVPANSGARLILSELYEKQGNLQAALNQLDLARDGHATALKGSLVRVARAQYFTRRGQFRNAIAEAGEAIRLAPGSHLAFMARAFAHAGLEEYEEAVADFTSAIENNSSSQMAVADILPPFRSTLAIEHGGRSASELRLRRYDDALADALSAVELEPAAVLPWLSLSNLYKDIGQMDKAVAAASQAIQVAPTEGQSYAVRAGLYRQLGLRDQALADISKADELGSVYGSIESAFFYDAENNYDAALRSIERAIQRRPDFVLAYQLRGVIHYHFHHNAEALKDFNHVIELQPEQSLAYDSRSQVLASEAQPAKALEDANTAIRLNPRAGDFYYHRATVLLKLRRYGDAIDDLARGGQVAPEEAEFHNLLAWTLATCPDPQSRNGTRAVEEAQRACQFDGGKVANDFDTLAAAYAEAGQFDEAIKSQKHALELAQSTEGTDLNGYKQRLELYKHHQCYRQSN